MTEKICFILNNDLINVEINPATVLLDFIRKNKSLTGTKEGCKEGDCGACTVLVGTFSMKMKLIISQLIPASYPLWEFTTQTHCYNRRIKFLQTFPRFKIYLLMKVLHNADFAHPDLLYQLLGHY